MGRLRGIVFDFDGTISETERFGQRVAYNLAFQELGLPWEWDEDIYRDLLSVAGGKERLRYYIWKYQPGLMGHDQERLVHSIHSAKVRHFSALAPSLPFRAGFVRLVEEASAAGVRIAVATTASLAGVESLLGQHPLSLSRIALIAANEAVARKKPFPDVYLHVLEHLDLKSEECVAIEDSQIGLAASLAADIPTLVTVSDYTQTEDFAGALAVLDGLGDPERPAGTITGPSPAHGIVDIGYLSSLIHMSVPHLVGEASAVVNGRT